MAAAAFDDEEEELLLLLLVNRRRHHTREWVHDISASRPEEGEFFTLIPRLRRDEERFFRYFRMSIAQFDHLVDLVSPYIKKQETNYRKSISVAERLSVCLRFLSTGDAFTTIADNYRMGSTTVGDIVEETCIALWKCLVAEYLPKPTKEMWVEIAERYRRIWHFPNCIGAIDGKHIIIQAPPNSGSLYFNYKGTFSIVLMALVDADYCFTFVDIGSYGTNSDGRIFQECALGKSLHGNKLDLPDDKPLPNGEEAMPYVIVGDPAFPLKTYLMKPFPGKNQPDEQLVFNYRLSRARRISENAFGLLAQRWRLYQRRLNVHADKAITIVKATCALHNFLQRPKRVIEGDPGNLADDGLAPLIEDAPMGGMEYIQVRHLGGNRAKARAEECRQKFKEYFVSPEGEVYWQWDKIRRFQPQRL